ncbi:hypothetical protein BMS3Abin02_00736 [bacterium BMS3Abin02]|nr:hypothetical protein BMS3Abin02_00736 [bacterium BMS3Abin02]
MIVDQLECVPIPRNHDDTPIRLLCPGCDGRDDVICLEPLGLELRKPETVDNLSDEG